MNLRSIDLNLLPVFEAIYAERSLTRASETLHVTQPAVSNALGRLRATFGDPLFVRSPKGMIPTPAAQSLIKPVREAMARLRSGLDASSSFDPATSDRVFNIAMRDVAASAIMPSLAKRLRMIAPEVRMQCHQVDRHEIPTELAAGRLDFAIDISALARTELDSVGLMSDRLVCALRKHHPRARKRMSVRDVLSLSHVTVSNRRAGRTLAEEAMSRAGGDLEAVMRLPHYQPAFHVIMSTDLALLAPLSLARRYDVSICELGFSATRLELLLFWRRDSADDPALRWAREEIVRASESTLSKTARPKRRGRRV